MSKAIADIDTPALGGPSGFDLLPMIESALAEPLLDAMPLGPTLTDAVVNELLNNSRSWGVKQRWKDRANWLRTSARARRLRTSTRTFPLNRVLVTWRESTPRADDQIRPVIEELGPKECNVIFQRGEILSVVPRDCFAASWHASVPHDPARWEAAFRRCWPEWKAGLKRFCREARTPHGAYESLSVHALNASILLCDSLEFLRRSRPSAIVTEYDRGVLWSCLVLAARQLRIPTFGLLHGVLAPLPKSFRYGLADFQLCWGELQRQNFIQAGEDPARLLATGCPRLTRELAADGMAVRQRLELDSRRPVVVLGTSPLVEQERLQIGEMFCKAIELLPAVAGLVRLHPAESLAAYADLACRYPAVRFLDNRQATLDEILAVADVVAVHNSGFGGDALVKRRLAVVIDIPPADLGYGLELVQDAGCPRVASPQELAGALDAMLFRAEQRAAYARSAECYVGRFCAYFGRESARRIAGIVRGTCAASEGICG